MKTFALGLFIFYSASCNSGKEARKELLFKRMDSLDLIRSSYGDTTAKFQSYTVMITDVLGEICSLCNGPKECRDELNAHEAKRKK